MFGIGFTELLLISIIAILFLGPDKLPAALVDMAKFIKSVKKTLSEAKSSLEEEVKIADLKEEALGYKKQLNDATEELKGFKNLSLDDFDDSSYDDEISETSPQDMAKQPEKKVIVPEVKSEVKTTKVEEKNELVTFTKKEKTTPIETKGDA
jgi:sec-independent protein translocase protein TatB